MSYLDVPRLHFSGTFTACPSTINNDPLNYNPSFVNGPDSNPTNIGIVMSWNPYGSHAFTIAAEVTSVVDAGGTVHTEGDGDPLIGAAFASYVPSGTAVAKLVDLDTEQQGVTRLFGLNLQLTMAGSTVLQGLWDNGGTLVNLWLTRVPSAGGDSAAGGAFQSVLQNVQWGDTGSSPLLGQLRQKWGDALSVRLTLFGFQADNTTPNFRTGSIMGTIGPQGANEPLHLPPRLLLPVTPPPTSNPNAPYSPSPLAWAPAAVSGAGMVTVDLGNSIPDLRVGGPPDGSIGTIEVAAGTPPASLGTVDLTGTYLATAGVVQFPITAAQAGQPLSILVNGTAQLAENAQGMYIDFDGASVYLDPPSDVPPGPPAPPPVTLRATKFGAPAPNVPVTLELVPPAPPQGFDNNTPAAALTFDSEVTTGTNGTATVSLAASNPVQPAGSIRTNIGGQLYYIGGSWAAGNNWNGTSVNGASSNVPPFFFACPLSVKLFNNVLPGIDNPTWNEVGPILYKYAYLYGYMASIVDLSSYASVQSNAAAIQAALSLPMDTPGHMPVTREMSYEQRQLILTWIANGCPPGGGPIVTNLTAPADSAVLPP